MVKKKISPKLSFKAWDIYEFIKGRKKMIITIIGTVLGYILTNNEVVAILAGTLCEMGISLAEYYLKKIKK